MGIHIKWTCSQCARDRERVQREQLNFSILYRFNERNKRIHYTFTFCPDISSEYLI